MTRRAKYTWVAVLFGLPLFTCLVWCFWPFSFLDRSVVVSRRYVAIGGAVVENGSAFDRASLDVTPYRVLILPDDSEVREGAPEKTLQIFMCKTLAFGGHPPERMSVSGVRKNMGCAVKAEGDTLTVATFGEWDSHIEGGTFMGLLFVVPEGVEVQLSGGHSAGREWHGAYLTKPKDAKGGYWYGPASPAESFRDRIALFASYAASPCSVRGYRLEKIAKVYSPNGQKPMRTGQQVTKPLRGILSGFDLWRLLTDADGALFGRVIPQPVTDNLDRRAVCGAGRRLVHGNAEAGLQEVSQRFFRHPPVTLAEPEGG
jgi:hypothetical protein